MAQSGVRGSRARSAALLASVLFHLVAALVLLWRLNPPSLTTEVPALQVVLVPMPVRAASPKPPATDPRAPSRTSEARRRRVAEEPSPEPRFVPPVDQNLAGRARQTLESLGGCERVGLNREARERCETQRWASAKESAAPRINLDRAGRYAESSESFLSRRPTQGCRMRATGDADPMGDSGGVRAGFTCVVPF
jgi:hypothetical protein